MSDTTQLVIILLPVLLISMSLHEMMHAFASDWLGDSTARLMGRLSINPLRHIDPVFTVAVPLLMLLSGGPLFGAAKPVQVNFRRLKHDEFGGAIVGMIGPLTNLVLAVAAGLVFNVVQPLYGGWVYDAFKITIELNVGLFVFNSIPWPPLDGSRLLYAFAPSGLQRVMEQIEATGIMGLVIFVFFFYQFGGSISTLMIKLVHLISPGLIA